MRRYWILFRYILAEILPTFFVGVGVFIFILLMFQMLRLTDTILVHDVGIRTLVHILSYMAISFVPVILPMSLIFSVLLAYNRLAQGSELIAFKALGLSNGPVAFPGLFFGGTVAAISLLASFQVGPWGNRQFEVLMNDIVNSKLVASIKEGTFSEGFFDMVIYTNTIDDETEELQKVFIYDERDAANPTTILAEKGRIFTEKSEQLYKAYIRLADGEIHKTSDKGHTKIHFETYDLSITNPIEKPRRKKSLPSLTYQDLREILKGDLSRKRRRKYTKEFQNRFALSAACLLFAILGIALGSRGHHRSGSGHGGVWAVGIIVSYWGLYVGGSSLVKSSSLPIWLCAWLPVLALTPAALWALKKNWR